MIMFDADRYVSLRLGTADIGYRWYWILLILGTADTDRHKQQCITTGHKRGKWGRTVKSTYGWWSEVKWSEGHLKIGVQYLWRNNIKNQVQYFLPLVLLFLCALLLTVVVLLCIGLLFWSVFLLLHVLYCFTVCVLLSYILQLPRIAG
jgi:hypothetical protein